MNKLEELKATAAKLQRQIKELEKPKQWEPRSGAFYPDGCRYPRRTENEADKCYSIMRTHNRLLAYVDEFGGDWEADWCSKYRHKYSVRYCHKVGKWTGSACCVGEALGTVYMSSQCQKELIDKLNSGEVIL